MAKTPGQHFGAEMRYWRERRGWSLRELARRMADEDGHVGVTIDHVTLARTERGERRVTLDEAVQVAAALLVPPTLLFLPLGRADDVQLTPKIEVHPHLAWKWLEGERLGRNQPDGLAYVFEAEAQDEALAVVRLFRRMRSAQDEAGRTWTRLQTVEDARGRPGGGDYSDEERRDAREAFTAALERLVEVVGALRAGGWNPPKMARTWLEEAQRAGIDVEGVEDVFTMTHEEG